MTDRLTDQQLADIEARTAAATAGPWCTDSWEIYQGNEYQPGAEWIGETCRAGEMDDSRADAEFVAAARTDVPAMAAEIRRLRAELATANARLNGTARLAGRLDNRLRRLTQDGPSTLPAAVETGE